MTFSWKRAAAAAIALYLALFALAFFNERQRHRVEPVPFSNGDGQQNEAFQNSRKNYASGKQAAAVATLPIGNSQKYEKIASLTQRSTAFESDRAKVDAGIAAHQGIVQVERGSGLKGRRVLHLGIGVPPEQFDAFIETVRAIGTTALITTVKNDKTNEYLQLRAKRTTTRVFVSSRGGPLIYPVVREVFRDLCDRNGIGTDAARPPRIHDLRHTFAVNVLTGWYRDGQNIEARLPALSTYLGHRDPRSTYWYLSAAPELLAYAAAKLTHLTPVPAREVDL